MRWKKLVWNMAFNGLSVVLGKTTTEILHDNSALERCEKIRREVIGGARACGVMLNDEFVDQMIDFTLKMRPFSPSMKTRL